MEYVNKSQSRQANNIIDNYLNTIKRPGQYIPRKIYQGFSNDLGKQSLINTVLLPEQNCRCCYCMKSLYSGGTIEHIIPEKVTPARMNYYFGLRLSGLNSNNICHTSSYMAGNSIVGQYPHEVAYHNFAIACLKCNNERRGNKEIYPMFLRSTIKQEVSYNRNTGKIVWRNDPDILNPTIERLGLNEAQLKAIRSVWIFGHDNPKQTYSTPSPVLNFRERAELIYRAFGNALYVDNKVSIEAYLGLLTEEGWRQVLQYDYFSTI